MGSDPLPLIDLQLGLHGKSLFLDFDGTLVGIAPTPDTIEVPADLARRLAALQEATDGALAIVTGRDVRDIEIHLPEFDGPIAGGHGSHVRTGDGRYEIGTFDEMQLETIRRRASEYAGRVDGMHVEEKRAGCVLHYRQAPQAGADAGRFVAALLQDHPDFVAEAAKMAFEIRPRAVTKAAAVADFSGRPPFRGRIPAFAGDDVSDEPAFRWVNDRGGFSIRIGAGPTAARYCAESVEHFAQWIDSELAALNNKIIKRVHQ